jgi:hypothetical protein
MDIALSNRVGIGEKLKAAAQYLMATVLTTVGKAWIVDKLDDTVATVGDYVGWGTGAGTAAVGDTTLFTEDSAGSPAYARIQGTKSQPAADTKRVVSTIVANAAKTITNAGLFTAVTAGTLIVKGDFTGIVLATNDQIQFTIDIQFT